MLQTPQAIVSDTSCLILLEKIGALDLLKGLFGTVLTTPEVEKEFGHSLPNWFTIVETTDKKYQTIIETTVDKGEASTIALAMELKDCLLIIDDKKGRILATQLGLTITGTIGILLRAKQTGLILELKPILEKIKKTNFRITSRLESLILKQAGE